MAALLMNPLFAQSASSSFNLPQPQGGKLGIYIKNLSTGEVHSSGAEQAWYLASGVKLPVALELLRQVDEKLLSLDDTVELNAEDYVDGSGPTNDHPPGAKLSLRYLLEQMMVVSDNTASDLIIRRIGLEKVNSNVARLVPKGFFPITTLADVRRLAYSGISPRAMKLKGRELLALKKEPEDKRARKLASILNIPEDPAKSLDHAFNAYYASNFNSASLEAYGELLRKLAEGEALKPATTKLLLSVMMRVETGKDRIAAGLKDGLVWAHKTGTQYARVCDFGLVWEAKNPERKFVVASCASGFASTAAAERSLRDLGDTINQLFP